MSQQLYLLKYKNGRVQGPLSTDDIIQLIQDKVVCGEEAISVYPNGRWKPISVEPRFYEPLLTALSEKDDSSKESVSSTKDKDSTSTHSTAQSATIIADSRTLKDLQKKRKRKVRTRAQKQKSAEKTVIYNIEAKEDPEYSSSSAPVKSSSPNSFFYRKKKAFILILGLLVFFVLWLSTSDEKSQFLEDYVDLQKPLEKKSPLPSKQVEGLIKKATLQYLQSSVPSYIRAQALLTTAIEGAPKNTYAMAILCLVYLELWPFSRQGTKSSDIVDYIIHKTSVLNKGGVRSGLCHSVGLIMKSKYKDATTMVESSLDGLSANVEDKESQKLMPFFYYLKARSLYPTGNSTAVLSYLDTLQKMIPQWIAPYILSAEVLLKEHKISEALSLYKKVLKLSPHNKIARIKVGLIEYKHFNKIDKATATLIAGLAYSEKVHPQILSFAYLALAEIKLKKGQPKEALKYARQAYSHNPADKASHNLILQIGGTDTLKGTKVRTSQLVYEGDQLMLKNQFQNAIAYYEQAYALEKKKNAMVAVKIAKAYWALSFSDQAILWLKKAINTNPTLISAYVLMAEYYSDLYDFHNAEKILKLAFRKADRSYELYRGRAHLSLKQGRYGSAVQYAKTALNIYSADMESYVIASQAYTKMGDTNEALAFATKALEVDPNAVKTQTSYAKALGGSYGWQAGANYFQKLMANYPLILEYRLEYMKYLFEEEQYNQAKNEIKKIIEIEPKYNQAYFYLGRILMFEGEFKSAFSAFLRSAILNPSDPKPTFYIGQLRLKEKKYPLARKQFQKVLALNPLYPKAHYYLGRVAFLERKYEEAVKSARMESRTNPRLILPYLLAGEAYEKLKQFLNCSVEYQKAVELAPENMSFYVKVARCYRKSGHLDLARKLLKKASGEGSSSKIRSGDPHLYKELGIIHQMKGDYQEAANSYCTYLNLVPLAPDRPDIEKEMRKLAKRTGEQLKNCG